MSRSPRWFLTSTALLGAVLTACAPDAPLGLEQSTAHRLMTDDASSLPVRGIYGLGASAYGCANIDDQAFGFWAGKWTLANPSGPISAVSYIAPALDRCALIENFNGDRGYSITRYDRVSGQWLQDYMDNTGLSLRLFGNLDAGGVMRMQDAIRQIPGGPALKSTIAWTPNADGSVHQLWLLSLDGGNNFTTSGNLTYSRTESFTAPATAPAGACATRQAARALDGLLDDWVVRDEAGRRLGIVFLSLRAGSCAIEELFKSDDGALQHTMLYHDRFVGRWFRMSTDNAGHTFRVGGSVVNGVYTATGNIPSAAGTAQPVRLVWDFSNLSAPVQRWEQQDGLGGWTTIKTLTWSRRTYDSRDL